jgi:hypothetical protein
MSKMKNFGKTSSKQITLNKVISVVVATVILLVVAKYINARYVESLIASIFLGQVLSFWVYQSWKY